MKAYRTSTSSQSRRRPAETAATANAAPVIAALMLAEEGERILARVCVSMLAHPSQSIALKTRCWLGRSMPRPNIANLIY
jgi:hypothetical protein